MIFIVTRRPWSGLALSDRGVRDILIDAGGQEYAPADFKRSSSSPARPTLLAQGSKFPAAMSNDNTVSQRSFSFRRSLVAHS
jgi:hypothetical protein